MMDVTLGTEALNEDGYMDYAKSPWERLTNSQTFASQRFSQLVFATEIFANKKKYKLAFTVLKMIFAFLNGQNELAAGEIKT